jgi:vacuolar iron transporter family protein
MPESPHAEKHFRSGDAVRDIVIGMSDGLTVPFALAAGLTGAVDSISVIITAGMAEIAAGSIAMGLGGYLAAKSAAEHYSRERARERAEVKEKPLEEEAEIYEVFKKYGLTPEETEPVVVALRDRPEAWIDFMMRFELGLEKPDPGRALRSALTIGSAYAAGGFIPLAPYFLAPDAQAGLGWSVVATLLALTVFGYIKGRVTGTLPLRSAWQTTLIGGLAAAAAFLIVRIVG